MQQQFLNRIEEPRLIKLTTNKITYIHGINKSPSLALFMFRTK